MSKFRHHKKQSSVDPELEGLETIEEFEDEKPTIRGWVRNWSESLSDNNSNGLVDTFSQWLEGSRTRFIVTAILIIALVLLFWGIIMLVFGSPFGAQHAMGFEPGLSQMRQSLAPLVLGGSLA